MGQVLSLRVDGEPRPQARPRAFPAGHVGRVVTWSPKTPWYHAVAAAALRARPQPPLAGAVALTLAFYLTPPKTRRPAPHVTKRPDLDNLVKAVLDAMTWARWWEDDAQVTRMTLTKSWADEVNAPGLSAWADELG